MIVLLLALVVVVVGVLVAAVMGRLPVTGMDRPTGSSPFEPLPAGRVVGEDVDELRFDQTLRGYRPEQVERTLDRLRDELRDRDAEIARLRGERTTY